ncbi:MAG: prolipoprotein diacylglyceryl transferase [candidate division NC10 bacterium RBG_16_65_8]|nr:MAG: prolipoprotein diacylglyceryl transferase [candidate division NC10 bacterium RBG_16_65_8]
MSAAFHWSPDPVLVSVGPLAVRWYGLFFASAFLVGYWVMAQIYRREGRETSSLDAALTYMVIGTFIGARLGHVLFYDPQYYLTHPLEIAKVWEGGLASHGGAAGILIALLLYTRKPGRPSYLWLLDRVVIPTALGGFFIRLGNFFNSEIVGRPTSGWWAVVFDRVDSTPRHPVQLYEALAYLLIFVVLALVYVRQTKAHRDGLVLGLFFTLVFSARFLLEFVKTPQAAYEAGLAVTVGQMLSVPFILVGIALMARARAGAAWRRDA